VEILRTIYRSEGDDWKRVRMSELKVGDVFTLDEFSSNFIVTQAPTMDSDHVWGVHAKSVDNDSQEASV